MPSSRFHLERDTDISGVSGTGTVAEGIEFSDGTCVIRWLGDRRSTVIWPDIRDLEAIHGHGGATRVVYDDPARLEPVEYHGVIIRGADLTHTGPPVTPEPEPCTCPDPNRTLRASSWPEDYGYTAGR